MSGPSTQQVPQLPVYQCHKRVRAARITGMRPAGEGGGYQLLLGEIGGLVSVDASWMQRHSVELGGYFVQYDDGYNSFSPAKAFEDGYTRLDWNQAMAERTGTLHTGSPA